ncbi:MAG: SsrA-binding protein SmpB [Phycisphaeraceae bacterium]|nr:SsrA-binding protein SmpB [Phycisphaerales bacterium]MCB9859338.1 SsrA-binding protein SmpB [Phycisphaeraceae bacterium]
MSTKKKKKNSGPPTIENRRARFEYFLLDTLDCGIVLTGSEVKAVRAGMVSMQEGFVRVTTSPIGFELFGVSIGEYGPAGPMQHNLTRVRKLLAHKREVKKFLQKVEAKGMTIVPTKMFFNERGYAKVRIALAQGKAKHDKRNAIQERDVKRDIDRAMSKRM